MPPKVRNVDQILAELDPAFKPQRQLIQKQQAALPNQLRAGRQRLEGEQKNAFGEINRGANRRGLNFSGIPLAEQADFTSDVFLPGLTDLESQNQQQGFALQQALNDIFANQRTQAQTIRQQEQDRLFAFQQEQRAAQRAAAAARQQAASIASAFGAGSSGGGNAGPGQEEIRQAEQSINNRERQILANIVQKGGRSLELSRSGLEAQAANGDLRASIKLAYLEDLERGRRSEVDGLTNNSIIAEGGGFTQLFTAGF